MNSQVQPSDSSRWMLHVLTVLLTVVFFLVSAGRFHFEVGGFSFSSGFNVYKIFPVLFLIWGIWRWKNPTKPYTPSNITLPFLSLIAVCIFSSLTSISPYQSFTETLELIIYCLFYLMLIDLPWNAISLRWIGYGFVAGTWYMIYTCVMQLYAAENMIWNIKLNGTYDYPNALGVFCILCASLLCWLAVFCSSKLEKFAIFITIATVLMCGLLTQSRAVYLSLVASVFVWIFRGGKRIRYTALISAVVLTLIALLLLLPKFIGIQSELQTQNEMSRLMIWAYLFENFLPELPFFGYGLGPVIPERMMDWLASTRYTPMLSKTWHPHNLYLYMLIATGVPGLMMFVWWMVTVIQSFMKIENTEQCILLSGIVGFLVYQCFEVHLLLGNIPVVMMAIMAIGTVRQNTAESMN